MLDKLQSQLLAAGLPVLSGIYDTGFEIRCHAVLTPEQQAQFAAIVAEYQASAPMVDALTELWTHVNGLYIAEKVSKGWDENAAGLVTLWAALGEVTPGRAAKLQAVKLWGDTAWGLYYATRAKLEASEEYDLPSLPAECPHHFAEVLFDGVENA
jgi:hypothetical protein